MLLKLVVSHMMCGKETSNPATSLSKNINMKSIARLLPILTLLSLMLINCTNNPDSTTTAAATAVSKQSFGEADGKAVDLYTLTNKNGAQVKITTYGGIITSWTSADKSGKKSSIVLG